MREILLDLTKPQSDIIVTEPTQIFGVFVGTAADEILTTVNIIHNKPELQSLTLVKAVLFDNSKFDFSGNLIINKGSKHTDTYLKASVLMLSKTAQARAVPSLEIMENDVKGGHGATVGQVDQEQLFYLASRGLSLSAARDLLIRGFLEDIMSKAESPEIKAEVSVQLAKLKGVE